MPDADVIIVGFRCAGAPLAYALHRAGVKVIVVDKDPLFSDQPISTHAIQPYGMMMFDRLGLGDVVRSLSPRNTAFRFQVEDNFLQIDLDGTTLDSRSPRRCKLDPALQRAALDVGVDARPETCVLGLLRDGDRVSGVRVRDSSGEHDLRARLVVGADGRNSSIAKLVGARAYLESTTPNAMYWSYFEQPTLLDTDSRYRWGACIHIERNEARAVFRTDSNLVLMAAGGPRSMVETWRSDPTASLFEALRKGALTAPLMENPHMVSKPLGILSMQFFMKQAVGSGWALVGDSGLHLNPTPGLGITDAVRDAADLSDAIVDGSEKAMILYWRRRDAESLGLYHFADDMGSEEYNNPLTRMLFRRAMRSPKMKERMARMMKRELRPMEMIPPATLLAWVAAESIAGNFGVWRSLPRALRIGRTIERQQKILDQALARSERGESDYVCPGLTNGPS